MTVTRQRYSRLAEQPFVLRTNVATVDLLSNELYYGLCDMLCSYTYGVWVALWEYQLHTAADYSYPRSLGAWWGYADQL